MGKLVVFEGVGGVKYVTFYALSRRMDVGIITSGNRWVGVKDKEIIM